MKKMAKRYSQHMYLFVIYGFFILCLLGIFFFFTYRHYQKNTLEEAAKDLENMCASVKNSVEIQLDNISTISMNLVYSNAVKTNFKEFSDIYRKRDITAGELVASRDHIEAIHDIITAIIGAYQSAAAINLYTLDGSCVESGYAQRTTKVNLEEKEWYEETMALNGHKYITVPFVNKDLPAKGDNQRSRKFISLVRLFLDSSGQPEGIAEVVFDCGKIFSLASQLESQNPDSAVYIYNSRQELVYPYNRPAANTDFSSAVMSAGLPEQTARMLKAGDGEQYLIVRQTIPAYDWTVILAKPRIAVYGQLQSFRLIFFLTGSLSILFTLLICFYISRRLTIPLQKLTAATGKITINRVLDETKVNLTSADSNIKELSLLCESIRTMYEKLRSTTQEALLSRTEETRAKLQATQSLINPHFLYNCLTNMSVMAEEKMNEDISHMCHALCDYFRYISASGEMYVPMEEEIFYSQRYLECMQLRFSDELEYTLEIAEETKQCYIPKLVTQPIVENAFKYAFQIPPPWKLHISSSIEGAAWIIRIEDNGGALSDEKKEELLSLYRNLDINEELKLMQIGGLGLKNVYLRLKLLYGDQAVFRIDNSQPQKTIFTVGGPIYRSREEYYEQHPKL
ncbi:cache domain-containing sensor histidine kinase [Clostridium sp. Marseille-P2415]|uniref:cache domain-containing sensor histidine kinase n=1 Tax=Clostridium sp. Marseille-P2415 TaxID=1805471 RepID=UPI001F158823|nr:sensor histidine kinase [Clostridium sp. Marseille-P2415]